MTFLRTFQTGQAVRRLQRRLDALGFPPGAIDGVFGAATHTALVAFQASAGLQPDGIAGPRTLAALDLDAAVEPVLPVPGVTVGLVCRMFPGTPRGNIAANLPPVLQALVDANLADRPMLLMALATIRAETEGFVPVDEAPSRFNTTSGGGAFDRYDRRGDLGNLGPPDGATFRGRGFVQLTGRANYRRLGDRLGVDLVGAPERAGEPTLAARILASFLAEKQAAIRAALAADDLRRARRLVNGGTHGLSRFTDAYRRGEALIV